MEIFTVTVAFTKLIFASKTERDCETKVASLPPDFPPIKLLKFWDIIVGNALII